MAGRLSSLAEKILTASISPYTGAVAGLLLQKTDDASRRRSTIHEQKRRATKLMAPIEVPKGATRFR